jgi:hypothetical protein
MKYFLFDLNKLIILKVVSGEQALRRCEYWADILIPEDEFYICGGSEENLSAFTHLEIRMIYRKLRQGELMGTDYAVHLKAVREIMQDLDTDDTSLVDLRKTLGRDLEEQTCLPKKERALPKVKAAKAGALPTRPKAGTLTERVWQAGDWLYSQQSPQDINCRTLRDAVISTCVENGVNPSTASTQYAKWKKALIGS